MFHANFLSEISKQFLTKLRTILLPKNLLIRPKQPCTNLYRAEEIAQILAISSRAAYNLCKSTKDFKVIRIGKSVRVNKQSFDNWLASA